MSQISYVVNVEGAIFRNNQYLMIIRGREEAHASGLLAFVGGTVDSLGQMNDVLENHLRREIMEEVGLTVGEITFTQAHQFMLNEQTQVINVIFLCEYLSGEAIIASPDEVAGIFWLNHDEIIHHPLAPMWLIDNIKQVEQIRLKNGG